MNQRLNYFELMPDLTKKLSELSFLSGKSLGPTIEGLIHNRVSQINGCAFCLDMDVKKAKMRGESELKMYHISVWRDSPLFSEKERLALEFAEAVTELSPEGISEELYNKVRGHFSDKEVSEMTFFIGVVNTWNRLNVVFRAVPGSLDAMLGLQNSGLK